ncbi:MAG TPA: MBL fold metallo-hydrolase [Solirubrobacteraceae bacterium]|nr:MBL fold metallo-hydrolase [Solirubrobacteraceae bacterium]
MMPGFGHTLATASGPALFALGQAGYALRAGGRLVLVDPWLSTALERGAGVSRPAPPALQPDDVEGVDLVCITHPHDDHLDGETLAAIAANVPAARFLLPATDVGTLTAAGVPAERITGIRPGEPVELAGARVNAVPAAHRPDPAAFGGYGFWLDDAGGQRAVGYLIELDGHRVFHAGDTVWWPGLEAAIRELAPDVAILPINGRDPLREAQDLWGNLHAEEAAGLAAAAGVEVVVPCHFDGVAGNLGDPETFVRALAFHAPEATAHVLHPGDMLGLPAA